MEQVFDIQTIDIVIRLFVAMLFGMVIGTERLFAHKTAGMRTYAFVSMGAALFALLSQLVGESYLGVVSFDPLRVIAHTIVGVGFLGAGVIFFRGPHLIGLTTASGLWVSAGIGLAVGFGFYKLGIIATLLTIFIFTVLWKIEQQLRKTNTYKTGKDD